MSALPARATSFTGDTNSTEAEQANRRALELIGSGQPILIGVRPAIEIIPALAARTI